MNMDTPIKISLIDVPEGRLRAVDPDWAGCLAGMFQEVGQKTPIDVVAEGKRYRLVAGAHRLEAAKIAKWREIEARVLPGGGQQPVEELRLHEILENLARKNFNALERCEALSEMKRIYEALHPETRNGGKRGNQHMGGQKRQNEIFSFCQNAAETTGLTTRAIQIAVAIFNGLTPHSRERLRGSVFAEKQSDLKTLSALDADQQLRVLDLILGEPPRTLADALVLAEGRRPVSETDRLFRTVSDSLVKLPKASRNAVFRQHKRAIVELVKKEGWLDG